MSKIVLKCHAESERTANSFMLYIQYHIIMQAEKTFTCHPCRSPETSYPTKQVALKSLLHRHRYTFYT